MANMMGTETETAGRVKPGQQAVNDLEKAVAVLTETLHCLHEEMGDAVSGTESTSLEGDSVPAAPKAPLTARIERQSELIARATERINTIRNYYEF